MRSARRLYWFSTSDQAAFTCSSLVWKSLYPQPDRRSIPKAIAAQASLRIDLFLRVTGRVTLHDMGRSVAISSAHAVPCPQQILPRTRLVGRDLQEVRRAM